MRTKFDTYVSLLMMHPWMGGVLSMGIVRLYYGKSDREQLWVRCRESLSPYRFCNYITTTGATSGVGTAYLSEAPEFTPGS